MASGLPFEAGGLGLAPGLLLTSCLRDLARGSASTPTRRRVPVAEHSCERRSNTLGSMADEDDLKPGVLALLDPPRRVRVAMRVKRLGEKPWWYKPSHPLESAWDIGQILIAIAGVVGSGIAGNLAYDLAKAAVISHLQRDGSEPLTRHEALAVAYWALARQ